MSSTFLLPLALSRATGRKRDEDKPSSKCTQALRRDLLLPPYYILFLRVGWRHPVIS